MDHEVVDDELLDAAILELLNEHVRPIRQGESATFDFRGRFEDVHPVVHVGIPIPGIKFGKRPFKIQKS